MFIKSAEEGRILILAPIGRDAQLLAKTLALGKLSCRACKDIDDLILELTVGAAACIAAEEALPDTSIARLTEWLKGQEPWADLPVVVLTFGGRSSVASGRKAVLLQTLGNVTLIERPARPETILIAAAAALRARLRQYETRHREELLTRMNMDLEQFAYSASHDLQEPLRNVSIYSELVARRYGAVLDAPGQELLGFLRAGAVRMQNLVQDLLIYTQAGSIDDELLEPVDANEVLQKALFNLAEAVRQSEAAIVTEVLPFVRIRPIHLQQVFQNLIGNALKYRREEVPRIQIRATKQGNNWVISVRDNGLGIGEEHRERVFGLFKRLHSRDEYDGTGIGLAICQRIVERSRGKIWVESELGVGSTFFFSLPA